MGQLLSVEGKEQGFKGSDGKVTGHGPACLMPAKSNTRDGEVTAPL